ncbi:DNA-binding response regulator [Mesorhizobium sp. 113-3-9]|uniref:response regulator n=1 Tax=Mesorhizobium sp. 113-3-9 TaxID=2744517 RepID=UPI001925DB1A|nr:response regulator transcription factor [Mesorhizobium sp. 113-3-9]BCG90125.1 DNA-binding response regulator [Mesorhizobium sp. 113-3-9]
MRILIVEDDPILSNGLIAGLRLCGWAADDVSTCGDADAALAAATFDAVVLDVMLPDGSGIDLLERLRARGDQTPVILLTALDDTHDRIRGLDSGADDYLGKPFDLDELTARLRALTRRSNGTASASYQAAGIRVDPKTAVVIANGLTLSLSRRELSILIALMERPGTIRSRGELEDRLYGWQEEIESNAVEVHVHNLRNKLGRDVIETVRGLGYRLRDRP